MPELLLELLSEEIPARMQARAAEDLKRLVCDGLKAAGLSFTKAEAFATPRRLALVVDGLPEKPQPGKEVRRGPRVDAPQQAIDGFLKSLRRSSVNDEGIVKRETEKGTFYFFEASTMPRQAASELRLIICDVLDHIPWPKSMRWVSGQTQLWIRPMRGILAIFNGENLNFKYHMIHSMQVVQNPTEKNTIFASDTTTGHPFLTPKPFKVKNFADYKAKLRKAKVILDPAERREKIQAEAEKLAKKAGLKLKRDPGLLDEVVGLVEWPVAKLGAIDNAFMELPPELLTTVMRHHQKYFTLTDAKGRLAPRFIVILNTDTRDGGKAAVAGNERVLRARLADARLFWDQDRKRRLESRVGELGGRVFHAKLGTVWDKVGRITALAETLARHCKADPADAARAATLAKADLSSGMVGEFPELQGVMGRYYALHDGEKPDVAAAIAEHYSPQGPADDCPSKPVSVAVALADKIDTLVGFWAIDERPTGSRDPFALRRAALGVIRLVIDNQLRVPFGEIILSAINAHEKTGLDFSKTVWSAAAKIAQLNEKKVLEAGTKYYPYRDFGYSILAFLNDRLKVHLREKGIRHDLIDAVFAVEKPGGGKEDDLARLLARVDALAKFLKSSDGANLHVAYKRAANIVRIEEKKDKKRYDGAYDLTLLAEDEERMLATFLAAATEAAVEALKNEDFTTAMAALARLRRPVDDFFDHVTVNCDDAKLRENRLRLLSGIGSTLDRVADFSKLEGGER
ncbi:MAG: glycine--tRNA ligase subunit beta [Rhodospirillales bacterium]|nr:glycine--tRNA ligase subunit beta [Rhodospirillales bacterium]